MEVFDGEPRGFFDGFGGSALGSRAQARAVLKVRCGNEAAVGTMEGGVGCDHANMVRGGIGIAISCEAE